MRLPRLALALLLVVLMALPCLAYTITIDDPTGLHTYDNDCVQVVPVSGFYSAPSGMGYEWQTCLYASSDNGAHYTLADITGQTSASDNYLMYWGIPDPGNWRLRADIEYKPGSGNFVWLDSAYLDGQTVVD